MHCVYESVVPRNYRVQNASVLIQAGTPAKDTYLGSPRADVVFFLLSVFFVISFSNITVLLRSCMFISVL